MKDISQPIYFWIACSNDLWRKWFANRFNGAYHFSEIEEFLFQMLVMRSSEQTAFKPKAEDLIDRLRVQYIIDFQDGATENLNLLETRKGIVLHYHYDMDSYPD